MQTIEKHKLLLVFLIVFFTGLLFIEVDFGYNAFQSEKADKNADSVEDVKGEEGGFQKVSLPLEDVEETDRQIEYYLRDLYPIISDFEIEVVKGSKEVIKKLINDTLGIVEFTLNFKVADYYMDPHPKILWELNIPEFTSRLYQLYKNDTILIDMWPNVVGAPKDRTFTGYYQAFRIRNWPSWKDPESDPLEPATPPGPGNPLGLFCVHYDENSLRYFHGTNKNYLLQNEYRALSHGCVRNDNGNIAKMKKFICEKVVVSQDISWWVNSKRSMMFDFAEEDKFPVRILYKTFDISSDGVGDYIVFFKDVYRYSDGDGWSRFDDPALMTFSTSDEILKEYKNEHKPNQFSIPDDRLIPIIEKLIANHEDYRKYYFADLLSELGK